MFVRFEDLHRVFSGSDVLGLLSVDGENNGICLQEIRYLKSISDLYFKVLLILTFRFFRLPFTILP